MEEDGIALEDGEIVLEEDELSNDSDNNYTPLERPANYSNIQPQNKSPVNPSESEEEFQSSESDSDSDLNVRKSKKPKIKLKPKRQQENTKRKKYDIWSTKVQEDVLAETLNSCDMTTKDRSRDVETYDFTLGSKYYDQQNKGNKRTRDERQNVNSFRQRRKFSDEKKPKAHKRLILDLTVDLNSGAEDIARDMANKLYEEKEDLILKVINVMGKQKAFEIFKETKKIEEEGGMMILNHTRRRTPGGVFLFLVRHDYHITPDQKSKIFEEERHKSRTNARIKQKEKNIMLKCKIAASKEKLLPDLLTRAELLACQNPGRKVKDETEESDCVNPPPTPETDVHENSGDSMDSVPLPVVNGNDSLGSSRKKIDAYEEDFLDIGCSDDMDLF